MKITKDELIKNINNVQAGDKIYLSGVIYTARDAAHKRIVAALNSGGETPFELNGAAIYYCGPSPARPGSVIGACGPTTSARMDAFTPRILAEGVKILIGKGARSKEVAEAIKKNKAVYLIATGGVAALLSKTVKKANLAAFKDLGPEAVYKLEVENMPLTVAVDANGKNIFNR
ncbi:FumA C-terminus/TtdB family hydratase beta subunit [Endomicrobium proavitum]|uniref:Fumarate hydratase n=1 Tax=Endomicrobium proavitum TaxID=1408281 RepID=A0A0G3WI25_9BACT|nr:FumA C-terminus/TtdB family hydratase beta subunit [Endomicrobium proavitum]AKL97535.1 fumarate hydratase [Endomicrobium proavitum]